ncbi:hypothetical protein LCGC14_3089820 [marine sediment metagenome]|uniref:Uncharacterized protein n=1 Tax=marine sediment metagenome TaxID=412755 RepID=A0A0F8WBF7_9ZZZZ
MAHIRFQLPIKGIHKGGAVEISPSLTSGYMSNVRARDVLENRVRIGQRPGLDKWGDGDQVGAAEQPIVAIISISSVS